MSANIAQSVQDRLRNRARERGESFDFLLHRFAAERLLYRLSISPCRDRFALKGASLFTLWADRPYRATNDLDLEGFGESDRETLIAVFQTVCQTITEDDGLRFDTGTIAASPIREEAKYGGVRIRIPIRIGNARADVQIDVGFGDAITPRTEEIVYPTLLTYPAPHLRAYPRITVIAEKWEAIVTLGERNGRMKDFYDLWVLSRDYAYDGQSLSQAIGNTFQRRGTPLPTEVPVVLTYGWATEPLTENRWRSFLRRSAVHDTHVALPDVVTEIATFIMPPTRALISRQRFTASWSLGGPWLE